MNLAKFVFAFASVAMTINVSIAQMPQATPEHQVLKKELGTWDATMKMYTDMTGAPISDPMIVKGKETNKMLGEFWIVSDFEASFGGMPFKGHGVFGYDSKAGKYSGSWVDSMTPTVSHMIGSYDKKTKTMSYETKGVGPDGKPMLGKNVVVYKDADHRIMTMYTQMPGKTEMTKVMEVVYKRSK